MAQIQDIIFDCRHPASLARFWATVLDGYQVAPYDDAELKRLKSNGINDPEDDPTVLVKAQSGATPRFFFVLVPEPKTVKNRVHLDLQCDDVETEVARLVELGGQVVARCESWITLSDPEGNEFCVMR